MSPPLSTVNFPLPTALCLLPYLLVPTTHQSPHCQLPFVNGQLPIAYCPLPTAYSLVPTSVIADFTALGIKPVPPLSTGNFLLPTALCLLLYQNPPRYL